MLRTVLSAKKARQDISISAKDEINVAAIAHEATKGLEDTKAPTSSPSPIPGDIHTEAPHEPIAAPSQEGGPEQPPSHMIGVQKKEKMLSTPKATLTESATADELSLIPPNGVLGKWHWGLLRVPYFKLGKIFSFFWLSREFL
ncbi:hypothetical protein R1flu_009254 [Riccia fluitans]|uniref:Uncharacterized protein n=1 Tax=Riccia fluitans TaxID=41844 RepID=A0ABD1Z1K6_9MARC